MTELSAGQVQALIRAGVPLADDLDLQIDYLDAQRAIARVPFTSRLVRPGGSLSGPVQMALADAAIYALVLGALGRVEMAVTSQLSFNFLAKPLAVDLLAKAQLLRLSRRQAVCEVRLYSYGAEDQLLAHATGTYSLPLETRNPA